MNLNKIFILGNVTRDPEVRALPSGQSVTNFSVATNRFYTDSSGQKKQEAEFHNVVCFGKLADISSRYLNKGSMLLVEGRIKTRTWQDSANVKHYKTEIIAENIQLAPKSMGGAAGNIERPRPYSAPDPEPDQPKRDLSAQAGEIPIIEENYMPPVSEDNNIQHEPEPSTDEIDIKDIPF
ncbi:MAG: single-stranded DNA-binding protein [Patescibacteria group bacterium]